MLKKAREALSRRQYLTRVLLTEGLQEVGEAAVKCGSASSVVMAPVIGSVHQPVLIDHLELC